MKSRYVGLAIGVWYVTAPLVWGYTDPFNWWHDIVLGASVTALSASFLVGWSRAAAWMMIAVGAYSMVAPHLHGYLPDSAAFFNDLVFGVLTVATGAALGGAALEHGGARPSEPTPAGG